jgi:serine/threonine-protein kinase
VTIPPVRGDTEQSATAQLNDLGLVVVVQRRVDPAIRPGRVIDTDPPAGETLPDGGTITLIVAAAPASPSASPSPAQS